jgi:hypothetical protein
MTKRYTVVMERPVRLSRPQRTAPAARRLPRPGVQVRRIVRPELSIPNREILAPTLPAPNWNGFQPDPYVDYGRFLTPEGGILFVYKDVDVRLRHTVWRVFAWTAATGGEGWYVLHHSPVANVWLNLACLLAVGIVNWLIVRKPVELYRRVEIRPDGMIIEGAEIFWLRHMENAWPAFKPGAEGQVLCGIYGTRFVEYLTLRRFDDFDRMIEVMGAHLQEAMMQLWARPDST